MFDLKNNDQINNNETKEYMQEPGLKRMNL